MFNKRQRIGFFLSNRTIEDIINQPSVKPKHHPPGGYFMKCRDNFYLVIDEVIGISHAFFTYYNLYDEGVSQSDKRKVKTSLTNFHSEFSCLPEEIYNRIGSKINNIEETGNFHLNLFNVCCYPIFSDIYLVSSRYCFDSGADKSEVVEKSVEWLKDYSGFSSYVRSRFRALVSYYEEYYFKDVFSESELKTKREKDCDYFSEVDFALEGGLEDKVDDSGVLKSLLEEVEEIDEYVEEVKGVIQGTNGEFFPRKGPPSNETLCNIVAFFDQIESSQ